METRKLQVVGHGTYTVSLPKEWVNGQDIGAGDPVALHDHIDGVLAVQAHDGDGDRPDLTVRTSSIDPVSIERTLRAAYTAGATTIRLDHEEPITPEQRRTIDRIARNRIGMSVTEAPDSGTTVRILLDSEEVSVRQSVRQLGFIALSMQRNAVDALSDGGGRPDAVARGEQADRLSAMVERSVTRSMDHLAEVDALGMPRSELFESWTAMRELLRVCDAARGIATTAALFDEPPSEARAERVRSIAEETRSVVSDGVDVVVGDGDDDTARRALESRDRTLDDIETFDRELADAEGDAPELRVVLERLERTAQYGGNIAELGLKRTIRQEGPVREPIPERGE